MIFHLETEFLSDVVERRDTGGFRWCWGPPAAHGGHRLHWHSTLRHQVRQQLVRRRGVLAAAHGGHRLHWHSTVRHQVRQQLVRRRGVLAAAHGASSCWERTVFQLKSRIKPWLLSRNNHHPPLYLYNVLPVSLLGYSNKNWCAIVLYSLTLIFKQKMYF